METQNNITELKNQISSSQNEMIESLLQKLEQNEKLDKENQEPNIISFYLIAKKSIDSYQNAKMSQQEKIDYILQLKVIHLEWSNIQKIQNLDIFTNLEVLFLQHVPFIQQTSFLIFQNKIQVIENLENLAHLQYLALNHNLINNIPDLNFFDELSYLDLSFNKIDQIINIDCFPKQLSILNLKGNIMVIFLGDKYLILKHQKQDYIKLIIENSKYIALEEIDGNEITCEYKLQVLGLYPQNLYNYVPYYDQNSINQSILQNNSFIINKKLQLCTQDKEEIDEKSRKELKEKTNKILEKAKQEFESKIEQLGQRLKEAQDMEINMKEIYSKKNLLYQQLKKN